MKKTTYRLKRITTVPFVIIPIGYWVLMLFASGELTVENYLWVIYLALLNTINFEVEKIEK